jgi:hypothetical protein
MRTLEQLEEEFSHLPWDDDPRGAVMEGLILFSDIIRILYAPGRMQKPATAAAIIRAINTLNGKVPLGDCQCEEVFSELLDKVEYVGEELVRVTISPEINEKTLLAAIATLQRFAVD